MEGSFGCFTYNGYDDCNRRCSFGYYRDTSGRCIKILTSYGGSCRSSTVCKDNLTCRNGRCACTDTQYYDSTCKTTRGYSEGCNPKWSVRTYVCRDPNNICMPDTTGKHRCLCDVSDYRRSGDCQPLSELRIAFQGKKNDLTQVNFDWIVNDYGLQVNYKIEWISAKGLADKGEKIAGKDGVMVSDLTPGKQYIFVITSKLSGDEYYADKFTRVEQTVDMLPAQPGPIVQNTSMLDSPPYNLTFQPSEGDAAKYKITLTVDGNSTFREVIEVVEPRVENLDLLPGRVYFYTIIAFNEKGDFTEPVIGSFSAGPFVEDDKDDENISLPIVAGAAGAALTLVAIIIVIIVILMRRRGKTNNKKSSKQDNQLAQKNNNIYMSYASNGYIEPCDKQYGENVYNEAYADGCRIHFTSHSNMEEEGTAEYDKEQKKLKHGSYENEI